ncbi:MAG: DNA-binding protein [Clostridia bacterium]|nr:DNA-binding protein [Clostridia bacterium]
MFEKDLSLALLYDLYSALLSEKKREVFEGYFLSDLSLAEIAEETGTSRQAVRDLISRTKGDLTFFEEKIGLMQKRNQLLSLCDALEQAQPEELEVLIQRIREVL